MQIGARQVAAGELASPQLRVLRACRVRKTRNYVNSTTRKNVPRAAHSCTIAATRQVVEMALSNSRQLVSNSELLQLVAMQANHSHYEKH